MKQAPPSRFKVSLGFFLLCWVGFCPVLAQTLWTGPMVTFRRDALVDWTLPANQDSISPRVIITRADRQGIFNIKQESEFNRSGGTSPADTEWANGSISDGIENLTFTTWKDSYSSPIPEEVGVPKVLHLITEDIYIDLVFTAWGQGGGGSGGGSGGLFAYRRSTEGGTTAIFEHIKASESIQVTIDPESHTLFVKGLEATQPYTILNGVGRVIQTGKLDRQGQINVPSLPSGLYILRLAGSLPLDKKFLVR